MFYGLSEKYMPILYSKTNYRGSLFVYDTFITIQIQIFYIYASNIRKTGNIFAYRKTYTNTFDLQS